MKEKYLLRKQVAELAQSTKYALIEGQENERDWVGKKLHDDIGSDLSAIRMMFSYDPEKSQNLFG
jgi:signal transduction histidine kinase